VVSNLAIQGSNLAGGDFDSFSILGAIGELRGEPMVWFAVGSARCVRLLGSIGAIDQWGGGECNVLGLGYA
jgi:hypothetical protein